MKPRRQKDNAKSTQFKDTKSSNFDVKSRKMTQKLLKIVDNPLKMTHNPVCSCTFFRLYTNLLTNTCSQNS